MERKKMGKENGYAEAKRKNTRVRDCGRVSLRSWSTIKRCAPTLWWLPSPSFSTLLTLLKPSHSRLLPVGYFLRYNVLRLGLSVRCFSSAGLFSTCYPSPYLVHAPCWYTRCMLHRAWATFLSSPFSSISISLALLVSFLSICPFLSPSPRGYSRYTSSCTQSTNVTAIKTRLRSPDAREGTIGSVDRCSSDCRNHPLNGEVRRDREGPALDTFRDVRGESAANRCKRRGKMVGVW